MERKEKEQKRKEVVLEEYSEAAQVLIPVRLSLIYLLLVLTFLYLPLKIAFLNCRNWKPMALS